MVDEALRGLAGSRRLNTGTAFSAAVLAGGVGSDELVLRVLEPVTELSNQRGVAARYHRARALERMGRYEEAEAEFLNVREADRSETGWYAMWGRPTPLDRPRSDVVRTVRPSRWRYPLRGWILATAK